MSNRVRSWVMGGTLLLAGLAGCRHSETCPTCGGHGHMHAAANGTVVYENAVTPASTGTSAINSTNTSSSMPMPMPSTGARVIENGSH